MKFKTTRKTLIFNIIACGYLTVAGTGHGGPLQPKAGDTHFMDMITYRMVPAGRDGQRGWGIELTAPAERPRIIQQFRTVAEAQRELDRLKQLQQFGQA